VQSKHLATSAILAQRILTKTDPMQAKLAFPFCDVRDVADIHVKVRCWAHVAQRQ
jgi:hypothetical protein